MRSHALLLAALLAFSSGCLSGEDDAPAPAGDQPAAQPMNATLPAEIHATETVTGSLDPLNLATQEVCTAPSAQCFTYPFTIEGNGSVEATAHLAWDLPANDFDLYVYEGETLVLNGASDVTAGPGNVEHVEGDLSSGDYEVIVVAWGVAQDTFVLDVTFS